MSTTSRDKTIKGHLVFGLGGGVRDRVSDARSNSVVDEDEVNRLPGNTAAQPQTPTRYAGIYANWNVE